MVNDVISITSDEHVQLPPNDPYGNMRFLDEFGDGHVNKNGIVVDNSTFWRLYERKKQLAQIYGSQNWEEENFENNWTYDNENSNMY